MTDGRTSRYEYGCYGKTDLAHAGSIRTICKYSTSTATHLTGGLNPRPSAGEAKARQGCPGSGEQGESTVAAVDEDRWKTPSAAGSDKSQPIGIVNKTEAFAQGDRM
jgi:hypothetical protein